MSKTVQERSESAWAKHESSIASMTRNFACNQNSLGLQALLRLLFELGYTSATLDVQKGMVEECLKEQKK